jgi:hypothetical protein
MWRLRYAGRMQRILIVAGAIAITLGLLWPWLAKLGFGRLPGDFHVEREGLSFHFPLTTSLIVSAVVTAVIWFLRR